MEGKMLIIAALAALMLTACAAPEQVPQGPIKIGVVAPLTGDIATIGQNVAGAAQLAAEEINAAGGVDGRMVEIIVEDGKCNGKDAATAGNKLINVDGVKFIVGGVCSPETLAIAPVAEQSQVIMLSPSASAPSITQAGDYIFRDYPSDAFVGAFAAKYLYETQGAREVAVLACLNDLCKGIQEVFVEEFSGYEGATVVGVETFENEARDLRGQLTKLEALEPDALYFIGFTEASVIGLKQKQELGWDVFTLGADTWDDPTVQEKAGDAAQGARYVIPLTPDTSEFAAKLQAKTGQSDVTAGAPQAYDAVHILAGLMREGATTPELMKDALYAMEPYEGVSGTIAFDANGDLENPAYVVKEYRSLERVAVHEYVGGQISEAGAQE